MHGRVGEGEIPVVAVYAQRDDGGSEQREHHGNASHGFLVVQPHKQWGEAEELEVVV